MKQKVFPSSAAALHPRRVYGRWWWAGTAAPAQSVAAISVSVMTDTLWGRKKIFTLVCQALVYAVPPFRYPLPMLCEHLRVRLWNRRVLGDRREE